MHMPLDLAPGVFFDGRSVILLLAGLFGGNIVSVISAIFAATYRIYIGGDGLLAGLFIIVLSAGFGLLFRYFYKNKPEEISALMFWVIGLVTHIFVLSALLFLPQPLRVDAISLLWQPVLIILPATTFVIGLLFRTEEKRIIALSKIKESEKRYQTLSENSPVGIFRARSDGYTTYVNPRWSELSGLSAEEAMGYGWTKAVHPEDRDELMKGWEDATSNQLNSIAEYRFLRSNGKIVWVAGEAVFEYSNDGEITGYIGTIYDITQRKLAEQALRESEENYRNLFENDSAIKLMIDPESGDIVNANNAAAQFYGWTTKKLKTMNINEILADGHSIKDIHAFNSSADQPKIQAEFQHRSQDEKIHHVKVFTSKIRFQGKDCFHSIIHDVTDQKVAEEKLKLLSKAIEQGPASVMITDASGHIEYVNPKFSHTTGYSLDEVLGQSPNILNSGEHSPVFFQQLWETIKSGKDWAGEIRNKRKNGEIYWESELISPIVDHHGTIINFISIREDITEQKRMIKEVVEAKEKAEEAERLKSAFVANMSHEIRTPLNAILGFTNMITSNKKLSADTYQRYSYIINKSAEGLLQIINDILDISKLETGQVIINKSKFDLNQMLERLKDQYQKNLTDKDNDSLTFRCLYSPTDIVLNTDENRLSQVFSNLLSNAFKFTEHGEIAYGVSSINNDKIEFIVSDTGIGISPQDQQRIFERFRQANSSTTRIHGGNGLGLAIVKSLVELMGGRIALESEIGEGTTFRFFLPLK